MKRTLLSLAFVIGVAANASAGAILASGDVNIINNLGSEAGNQTFFSNLLGGGDGVVIRSGTVVPGNNGILENFYDSLAGVTATQVGAVSGASLAGAEVFIGLTSSVAYTAPELAALSAFSAAGGLVFIFGENDGFPTQNAIANAVLASLGSGMSLGGPTLDPGFHNATGLRIVAGPLTAGVNSFNYAAYSAISGGTAVFLGLDGTTAIIAAENVAVPEPAVLALLGAALGLGRLSRRRR